ncbi:MAG: hypothetical protein ACLTBV_24890 [Enterocloster bolteae]
MKEFDIDEANRSVIAKVVASQPVIKDVVPAKSVIKELNEGKVILHAGPPIQYENMPDPVQGSCVGAALVRGMGRYRRRGKKDTCVGRSDVYSMPSCEGRWARWAELHPPTCRYSW